MPDLRPQPPFKSIVPSRTFLLVGLLLVLLAQRLLSRHAKQLEPQHPNLLLISVDTLRADELGAYGSPLYNTPALDRLTRHSTQYEMPIAAAPWTLPSLAGVMTGLEPAVHGTVLFHRRLPAGALTLAEKLRAGGYHTAAAVTHFVLGPDYGFDRGFERFERKLIPSTDDQAHLSITSPPLTELGIEMLRSTPEPYFVWLHYFDPHFHYLEHPPVTHFADPGPNGRTLYRGEIQFTDESLAALLAAADALPHPPVIVFLADHGEQFMEHGLTQHTKAVYQEVVTVPLLVSKDRHQAPSIVAGATRLLDAHKLILSLTGVAKPAPADESSDLDPVLIHTVQSANLRAIVAGPSKLIVDLQQKRVELFDLYADPGEKHDLSHERPELLGRLCTSLAGHFTDLEAAGAKLQHDDEMDLSHERQEQLGSLGYSPSSGTTGGPSDGSALREVCAAATSVGLLPEQTPKLGSPVP